MSTEELPRRQCPSSEMTSLDDPPRLIDSRTGLPALTGLFAEVRPLAEDEATTVLYVHLPVTALIEERYGQEALDAYTDLVTTYLTRVWRDLRSERGRCVVARAFADDYVLLVPAEQGDETLPAQLADGMGRHLRAVDRELASLHRVHIGRASTSAQSRTAPERRIYRCIQRAQQEATNVGQQLILDQARLLEGCIARRAFHLVYQPIVSLADGEILGYEALVRCDRVELKNPLVLFDIAERSGKIWPLSRVLRRMAVDAITHVRAERLMFVNVHPTDFDDPQLLEPEHFIVDNAAKIVIEVTERAAIGDFERFRQNVDVLRGSGVRIAVDDLGAGYAALNSVAELNPDFIKFDMSLVRDIDASEVRQSLLRNMIAFAASTGAKTVGEGIETQAELETLIALGCHYGQGFLLARPHREFIEELTLPGR